MGTEFFGLTRRRPGIFEKWWGGGFEKINSAKPWPGVFVTRRVTLLRLHFRVGGASAREQGGGGGFQRVSGKLGPEKRGGGGRNNFSRVAFRFSGLSIMGTL